MIFLHRSRLVQQRLKAGYITRLNWPVNSPDMDAIENMWDYITRAIHNRINFPWTVDELFSASVEEWNYNRQNALNHLVISKHRQVNNFFSTQVRLHRLSQCTLYLMLFLIK